MALSGTQPVDRAAGDDVTTVPTDSHPRFQHFKHPDSQVLSSQGLDSTIFFLPGTETIQAADDIANNADRMPGAVAALLGLPVDKESVQQAAIPSDKEWPFKHLQRPGGKSISPHDVFTEKTIARPPSSEDGGRWKKQHVTNEEFDELGYPQMPKEFTYDEYWREQMLAERTDPRMNPNLLLDVRSQEYWDNAMRKPYAQFMMKHQGHWNFRRGTWLQQRDHIEEMNAFREYLVQELEGCSMELRRLVMPIMKYKITESLLAACWHDAREMQMSFRSLLETERVLSQLCSLRSKLDSDGEEAAEEMFKRLESQAASALEATADAVLAVEPQSQESHIIVEGENLTRILEWGLKCKQDGMVEWKQEHFEEARTTWKQAHETLKVYKASNDQDNKRLLELHASVLKNLAQVAIKLEHWGEALQAADLAIAIDQDDHKAWFRRACALQGLGRLQEASSALDRIEAIAVGRPDRERICKDTVTKRDQLRAEEERNRDVCKRGLELAAEMGIFCDGRDEQIEAAMKAVPCEPKILGTGLRISEGSRKRLTKDGAEELLETLLWTYTDTDFHQTVRKLAHDVHGDRMGFLLHMKKVALEAQKPVLEKWGFEASQKGVVEMQMALADHTRGKRADLRLKELADKVLRALYGDMYERIMLPV